MAANWQERFTVVPAVFMIVRNDKGQILMLRRANTGFMDGFYSLPAGHLDGGETAQVAVCREALEEVGITVRPEDLRLAHVVHEKADGHERINLGFEASSFAGEPYNAEPEKCSEIIWADLQNLPEQTVPQVRAMLQNLQSGHIYSEFGF